MRGMTRRPCHVVKEEHPGARFLAALSQLDLAVLHQRLNPEKDEPEGETLQARHGRMRGHAGTRAEGAGSRPAESSTSRPTAASIGSVQGGPGPSLTTRVMPNITADVPAMNPASPATCATSTGTACEKTARWDRRERASAARGDGNGPPDSWGFLLPRTRQKQQRPAHLRDDSLASHRGASHRRRGRQGPAIKTDRFRPISCPPARHRDGMRRRRAARSPLPAGSRARQPARRAAAARNLPRPSTRAREPRSRPSREARPATFVGWDRCEARLRTWEQAAWGRPWPGSPRGRGPSTSARMPSLPPRKSKQHGRPARGPATEVSRRKNLVRPGVSMATTPGR